MKTQMCLRNSCDLKGRREKVNGCFPKGKKKADQDRKTEKKQKKREFSQTCFGNGGI